MMPKFFQKISLVEKIRVRSVIGALNVTILCYHKRLRRLYLRLPFNNFKISHLCNVIFKQTPQVIHTLPSTVVPPTRVECLLDKVTGLAPHTASDSAVAQCLAWQCPDLDWFKLFTRLLSVSRLISGIPLSTRRLTTFTWPWLHISAHLTSDNAVNELCASCHSCFVTNTLNSLYRHPD